MKYLPNPQFRVKFRPCDHVFAFLEEKHDYVIQKCIRCFRIFEEKI